MSEVKTNVPEPDPIASETSHTEEDSKLYASEPNYICFVKRDPEKGYLFDRWKNENDKEDCRPDNVSSDDISVMISHLAEGDWKDGWVLEWYPKQNPSWTVHIARKTIVHEKSRPTFEFELRWFAIPKKEENDDPALKVCIALLLLFLGGIIGASIEYYLWSESLKEQKNETTVQVQILEKKVEVTSKESRKVVEEWGNVKKHFEFFEDSNVQECRNMITNDTQNFFRILPDNVDIKSKVFTVFDYDEIHSFLEAMQSFAETQKTVTTSAAE